MGLKKDAKKKAGLKSNSKSTPIENQIRKLRFLADEMTQQELAERVGVSRQTIVAIEKAKYSPTLELAFRIAHVFEMPLEEVFVFVEEGEG